MTELKIPKKLADAMEKTDIAILGDRGEEYGNPIPVELPLGYGRPESLIDQMKRMVRSELSQVAGEQGHETFEEADDFDVQDKFDMDPPATKYELMEEEYISEDARPDAEPIEAEQTPEEPAVSEEKSNDKLYDAQGNEVTEEAIRLHATRGE